MSIVRKRGLEVNTYRRIRPSCLSRQTPRKSPAATSTDGLVTFTGDAAQQEAAAGLWLLK